MCAYLIISKKMTAEIAWNYYKNEKFKRFRDESCGSSTYDCTIFYCLK